MDDCKHCYEVTGILTALDGSQLIVAKCLNCTDSINVINRLVVHLEGDKSLAIGDKANWR